jgi:hypothetical protein
VVDPEAVAEPFIENLEAKSRETYHQIDCRTAGGAEVILEAGAESIIEAVLEAGGEEANEVILEAGAESIIEAALEAGGEEANEVILEADAESNCLLKLYLWLVAKKLTKLYLRLAPNKLMKLSN